MRPHASAVLVFTIFACTPRESVTPLTVDGDGGAASEASNGASTGADAAAISTPFRQCMAKMGDCSSLAPTRVACPPSYPSPDLQGACGWTMVTAPATCRYGSTICECVSTGYCGGPVPPPAMEHGMGWRCRPELAVDECPRDQSEIAVGKCTTAGKKCTVSGCSTQEDCVCSAGAWKCTSTELPPRP